MKLTVNYIGKMLKTTGVLTVVAAFVGAGIMLCCLAKPVQASVAKTASHCHSAKTPSHGAGHASKCDCCKIKLSDSETLARVLDQLPNLGKPAFHAFLADTLAMTLPVHFVSPSYTGPPEKARRLPVYLRLSNLRL